MRISIVTPCFNAEKYIDETLRSIRDEAMRCQASGIEVEHIIVDGMSTDTTLPRIQSKDWKHVKLISEPDKGMYDALAKGMRQASGDIVCYLNAGDIFNPNALSVVADVFADAKISWITAMNVHVNEKSQVTEVRGQSIYRRKFILRGYYGRILPFIQQESTFWRRALLAEIDYPQLAAFQVAGDHYLWQCFARNHKLFAVNTLLGCFRVHAGQLSSNLELYFREVESIAGPLGLLDRIFSLPDQLLLLMQSRRMRIMCSHNQYIYWDPNLLTWTH